MANNNGLQPREQKHKFSVMIKQPKFQKLISDTLKDPKRANNFIANVSSVVANNPALQSCNTSTILTAAFLAESLQLSMSPQLGYCYLVPYEVAMKDANGRNIWLLDEQGNHLTDGKGRWLKMTEKRAQFQMGYKGYIQLANRSGQYKKLTVLPIKQGELIGFNPIEETIEVNLIKDDLEREHAETIGYYAMFEYVTGFRKAIYWSKRKMLAHADKYSAAFSAAAYEKLQNGEIPDSEMWRYSSFWYKDFGAMAMKTMLRQLISKWGVMSVEMENVISGDMSVINDDGTYDYVDTPEDDKPPAIDQPIIQGDAPPVSEHPEANMNDDDFDPYRSMLDDAMIEAESGNSEELNFDAL